MAKMLNNIKGLSCLSRTKQFILSREIRDSLVGYRKDIDDFRLNFMVCFTIVDVEAVQKPI